MRIHTTKQYYLEEVARCVVTWNPQPTGSLEDREAKLEKALKRVPAWALEMVADAIHTAALSRPGTEPPKDMKLPPEIETESERQKAEILDELFPDLRPQEGDKIDMIIKTFPDVFGLRAFSGMRFTINRSASYERSGHTMLYVYTEAGQAFAKATPDELRMEVVEL